MLKHVSQSRSNSENKMGLKELIKKREQINREVEDILANLTLLEEMLELMLTKNMTVDEAKRYMLKQSKEG